MNFLVDFFKALNGNVKPSEIAHGFTLAFMLALIPSGNLLWILLFCITLFLRINKAAYFIFLCLFKLVVFAFDPFLDQAGYIILSYGPVQGVMDRLYNIPFFGFFGFANTIVTGAFATSIILYIPLYFLFLALVQLYRNKIAEVYRKSFLYKFFMKIPFFKKFSDLLKKAGSKI